MKRATSIQFERRERMLLIIPAIVLVVTVVVLLKYLRPSSEFGYSDLLGEDTFTAVTIPIDQLASPRYATLEMRHPATVAEQVTGISTNLDAPPEPADVQVVNLETGSMLVVVWDAPLAMSDASFRVYRSSTSSTLGEQVFEGKAETFRDTDVVIGKTYYYTVRTVSKSGAESANVESVAGTPTDLFAPAAPTSLVVENAEEGGRIIVSWVNPTDDDFASVNVYRSSVRGELGTLIATALTDEVYEDTGIEDGVEYSYTVTSVDRAGNESSTELVPVTGRDNPFLPVL
ncbi:MAG: hypothetical protein HYV34_02260 [Candidatus Kerfeldbacteria bacterium]|nr:hypothetical protein [Candidatus Kerfeldbacteria bacterium]